ncbi:MAG: glycerol-3-phosphate dehydrogenase, partial [Casimicrobiaceae bacterium]
DDLAAHTSSSSSKLIHGGLRYLEHYEFRLVGEALSERETLLGIAPHIIWPLQFVMPHVPELRPAWMIRAGLLLYDHLGKREKLPASRGVSLGGTGYGENIRADIKKGFLYSDCWVDDARLVALNARAAADLGATILTRTACVSGRRSTDSWEIDLRDANGSTQTVKAKCVINAAGPWVKSLLDDELQQPTRANVKQVKGSHIVVRRQYPGSHAFILQNDDKRIVFLIPYENDYTLIGTTDIEVRDAPGTPTISAEETDYLCRAANRYLATPIAPSDVVWSYAGVRPLYDDGEDDPSAVTRDYTLILDVAYPQAPLLSVFGGKITTYRRLAESVMDKLRPSFPQMTGSWTGGKPLPGGDLPQADFDAFLAALRVEYPALSPGTLHALARRQGSRAKRILGSAKKTEDLGTHFGDTLYACEVDYLMDNEWARTADDVLWRRTKCGLHMSGPECEAVAGYITDRAGAPAR